MSAVAGSTAGAVPALARMAEIRTRFQPTSAPAGETSGTAFASLLAPGSTTTAAPAGAAAAGAIATGDQVVETSRQYLGVPYVWGGTDPSKGLDCSGFVQRVYRDLGVELPRVSRDQARAGTEVPSLDQARPGDLIAFGEPVDHISIYVGDGKIVHAPRTGDVVKVADIHRPIATIRRIVPDGAATATTTATAPGLGAADAIAMRQLLQLVTRSLTATPAGPAGASYATALGIGADDATLGSLLNGTTL